MYVSILGRQPELSLAELEAIYGPQAVTKLNNSAAFLDAESVELDNLGGQLKIGRIINNEVSSDEESLMSACLAALPRSEQKIILGLSWYGANISAKKAFAFSLELKKRAKRQGHKMRIVPNKQLQLSAAQVLHNKLTESGNLELLLIAHKENYVLAKTDQSQDIESYTARDFERPARDARVGMLPPKLAQIMLNLATAQRTEITVLDCFCGTGVLLQEALLMGYSVCGSDLEQRMVDMTQTNLDWLSQQDQVKKREWRLSVGDARKLQWQCDFNVVVSEIYLGPPLSNEPASKVLDKIIEEIDELLVSTLKNIARQTKSGVRLCLAVPAWNTKSNLKHLPSVDSLEDIGYNHVSFATAQNQRLVYSRPDQVVARELITLVRK